MEEKPQYEVEDWQAEFKRTGNAHKAADNYSAAKLRNAEKREEYRFAKETFLEKILAKLFRARDKSNTPAYPQKSR